MKIVYYEKGEIPVIVGASNLNSSLTIEQIKSEGEKKIQRTSQTTRPRNRLPNGHERKTRLNIRGIKKSGSGRLGPTSDGRRTFEHGLCVRIYV
ncbi:hypothetical protein [Guptibacillus hwajinpoensis]|uniref:hypothetical protein n=1 Tax=Guptibacillus hwajinpoensis TaxID=208199 RepID=UPI00273D7D99|nr:hypothetical protein [Pseudalkalibacillus hwajinpoensis]WLR58504.1 hypothetical protein LC071_15140 [Pseudalkalibacillus hwajinpoensis]